MLADIDKPAKRIANGRLVEAAKINQAIGRLKERYPRVARYYHLTYDQPNSTLSREFDADKRLHAERLHGCYLLKISRKDLSGDEFWRIYILLTRAQNAFRDMKSPLAERPILHHLVRRADTHMFLCVLAYHLLISIAKTLLDNGVHTSRATVRDTLKTHQTCTVVLPADDGACLRIRRAATPDPARNFTGISTSHPKSSRRSTPGRRAIATKKNLSPRCKRNLSSEVRRSG